METSRECVETWRNVEFQSEQTSEGVFPHLPHPHPGSQRTPTAQESQAPQGHVPARWMLLSRQAVNS